MMQNPFNGIETRLPSVCGVIRCVENPFNGIERELFPRAPTTNPAMGIHSMELKEKAMVRMRF
jgi:hypothetical protein